MHDKSGRNRPLLQSTLDTYSRLFLSLLGCGSALCPDTPLPIRYVFPLSVSLLPQAPTAFALCRTLCLSRTTFPALPSLLARLSSPLSRRISYNTRACRSARTAMLRQPSTRCLSGLLALRNALLNPPPLSALPRCLLFPLSYFPFPYYLDTTTRFFVTAFQYLSDRYVDYCRYFV